ncbi:MAG: ATP-dependent helicase [Methylococcales bacterium]
MRNLMEFKYAQSGASSNTNDMGMRAMQSRAYEGRNSQYLLLKAPPASGKSRALMFLALDKLYNQGVKKAIVAVPERSIGGSFDTTELSKYGFFCDWQVDDDNNLCTPGGETSKTKAFKRFMASDDKILICTHATLRFAFPEIEDSECNDCLIAIDEFHHVSADGNNVLGDVLRSIMTNSSAHIVAMTGSYFRGDSVPVLTPELEAQFDKVSFNYYEQLNGYKYLKSLGIGYHFYQGRYTDVIQEVLISEDGHVKKTIIHIPNVNSGESTKEKYDEVDAILEILGEAGKRDPETGVIPVTRPDGSVIKVADLVEENNRDVIQNYLRKIKHLDDMDVIIALGMAKEGFDWEYCEHALTVGYRSSLTEIIQIIGRCTRDSSNKTHAQFTNLIAQPDSDNENVTVAVNNMLKAITCSLLMEQVLAPNFKFKAKKDDDFEPTPPGTMKIGGFKEPSTKRTKDIIESDLADLKAAILQDDKVIAASVGKCDPEVVNKILIPKIIQRKYPDLSEAEIEEVRQQVVVDSAISSAEVTEQGGKKFVRMADKFINIDELTIDLIDTINPFQKAFEILSKSVTTDVLNLIQEAIQSTHSQMDFETAKLLWPKVKTFFQKYDREPDFKSTDLKEKELGECLNYIKAEKRKRMQA